MTVHTVEEALKMVFNPEVTYGKTMVYLRLAPKRALYELVSCVVHSIKFTPIPKEVLESMQKKALQWHKLEPKAKKFRQKTS